MALAVPVDTVADAADPSQLLEVEVDEVLRLGVLVTQVRTRRLQLAEPTELQWRKLGDRRGDGECVGLADPTIAPAPAALEDLA